jgi:Ca-activated chloride channel family protein
MILLFSAILIARPQATSRSTSSINGIDIMLAVDISRSMEETDIQPSRIEASQRVIKNFIKQIEGDRVGMYFFLGSSAQMAPLTYDYEIIDFYADKLTDESIIYLTPGGYGTAVGDAIVYGTEKFQHDIDRTKVLIVITDAESDSGLELDTATEYAKNKGVKVYPVFVNSKENSEHRQQFEKVAEISGTQMFQAKSESDMQEIVNSIRNEERTEFEQVVSEVKIDKPYPWIVLLLLFSIILFFVDIIKPTI